MPMLKAIGTTLVAAGASGVATVANDGLSGMIGGSVAAEHKASGPIGGRPSPLSDVQRFLKISVADLCEMPHRPDRRRWSAAAGAVTARALPTERKPPGSVSPSGERVRLTKPQRKPSFGAKLMLDLVGLAGLEPTTRPL